MKKFLSLSLLFVTILFSGCNFKTSEEPESVQIKDGEQFSKIIANYFYEKKSEELYGIAKYLNNSPLLSRKNTKAPVSGFFIGILHENPEAFDIISETYKSSNLQKVLKSSKEFAPDMEEILDNKVKYYPESAAFLDGLWGYFSATGDERVLKKMCYIQEFDENPIIRGAAKWSYNSNMEQHPKKIKSCDKY